MAYRQIHDDVPVSATLSQLSHFAERLFWRLLSQTDTWGRLPGDRAKIRAIAIPRLDVTDQELESALEELVQAGRIHLYVVSGIECCQMLDFDENQMVSRLKRAPSKYPPAPEKSLHDRRSAETEDREDRRESDLPTGVAREPARGLPVDQQIEGSLAATTDAPVDDVVSIAQRLAGADEGTPKVLAKLKQRGCGEREFAMALESLEHRRQRNDRPPLQSEVRYFVSTLTTMLRERQGAAA